MLLIVVCALSGRGVMLLCIRPLGLAHRYRVRFGYLLRSRGESGKADDKALEAAASVLGRFLLAPPVSHAGAFICCSPDLHELL